MHSYLITGLRMGPLLKLLRKRGFNLSPKILGRLIFIMHNAFWASFFTRRERRYRTKIESWPVPEDPVIIIGHWRTGSTYLHLLLARDPQFVAPSLFQTAFPDCFMSADKFYRPVMGSMLGKRPMDNVRLGFDDPQEDEFGLMKLSEDSPLWDVVFPRGEGYFILDHPDFNPPTEHLEAWKQNFLHFLKKVRKDSGRTLVLKNPAHSLRIPLLLETFPRARFIHIHRHPYQVVASSLNLWHVLAKDNQLKGKIRVPSLEMVTDGLIKFYDVIERDLKGLPEDRKCEVRFMDLENDPVGEIKRIYRKMNLNFTPEYEGLLRSFLSRERDFRKNSYTFDDHHKDFVYGRMMRQFERFNYSR